MTCGERGYTTVNGKPCGAAIAETAKACVWHKSTPAQRKLLAAKGVVAAQLNRCVDARYDGVRFGTRAEVVAFAKDMAEMALKERVEPKRIETALKAASVALTAHMAATQERMVEALLRIEHGGTAMMLLSRLQDGGKGKPLPARRLQEIADVVTRREAAEGTT